MFDFTFHNPTRIEFGRGKERNIGLYMREFDAKRTLLIYGSERIKKDGLFDTVAASLKENGIEFIELGGVVSNPVLSKVYEGIELARKFNADSVLSVGGGSCLDSAKAIAVDGEFLLRSLVCHDCARVHLAAGRRKGDDVKNF